MATWDGVHPQLEYYGRHLLALGQQYDPHLRLTSGYRSIEKQAQLYQRYLRGEHSYPVARPGTSKHNYGRAFDLHGGNDEVLNWLGRVWESWGGVWGGRFRDPIHFEA